MTGNTLAIKRFDDYLSRSYPALKETAQNICWNDDSYQDILNNNLIKIRERIVRSGWTNTNYTGDRGYYSFIWRAVSNEYKTKKKREKSKQVYDFDNERLTNEIQAILEIGEHDSQPYYEDIDQFARTLFKYLDRNYDEKKATLFKTYFLTKANTYRKLAKQAKLTKKHIGQVMGKMKKDVKSNLQSFIDNESESWRPVRGFEKLYMVSNKGRVKNNSGKILKPDYKNVFGLWVNNKRKYRSLDQL